MRKLGQAVGVEAMSLYNHVANKNDLLDGILDLVLEEIELPEEGEPWRVAMQRRALSARRAFIRHPWAPALIEARVSFAGARLEYAESVLAVLRRAGFSPKQAYRAFLALDSYIYGFAFQEASWPMDRQEVPDAVAHVETQISKDRCPHIMEVVGTFMDEAARREDAPSGDSEAPTGPDEPTDRGYHEEFLFGLELLLEGLDRALKSS